MSSGLAPKGQASRGFGKNVVKMWWKFLVVIGGVDIIIRCVENGGLPVGEAGGAHCAQTKEIAEW